MTPANETIHFRPELLSGRERQILDLAIEGHTDEQIAQSLEISVSTVNSYWVRIRGKIGPYSRTEIVSKMLRRQFKAAHAEQVEDLRRMRENLAEKEARLEDMESEIHAQRGDGWATVALHYLPEAVLVAKGMGKVVYGNREAERMFRRAPGALQGVAVCDLTVSLGREARTAQVQAFMEAGVSGRLRIGFDEPCYAESCPQDNFRATITAEGFDGPEGFMASFTVRETVSDLEAVVRSMRRPLYVT